MTDMVVIGRFVGKAGLSSVTIGGDVLHFFMFLGMGFATAGQIIVSQVVGAGEMKRLNLFGVICGFGIRGFWYGSAIASYGYGIVVFPYFLAGKWKNYRSAVH